jgi:AcrR family transcriptional regulator
LFSERGYVSVTTGDVAAAAGVAEGSVFHYFGSKPGLLRAVGERYGAEFAAAMFDVEDVGVSPDSVEALLRRAFTFVGGSYAGFGLFLLSDSATSAPLARKANREVVTEAIEGALLGWQARGEMGLIDAPVAAHLLFGLVESALKAAFAPEGGIDPERVVVATVRAVVRILDLEGGTFDRRDGSAAGA